MSNHNTHAVIELDPISSTVLNSLKAHIAILNGEGTITACNKQWEAHRKEFEENWSHPALNENILSVLQQPLADGNDCALQLLLGIKDVLHGDKECFEMKCKVSWEPQQKTFAATIKPLTDEGGAIVMYEDISAQIESQTYLKETQEKFEKHFQNSLYGILIADENNTVIEANNIACKLLEISSNDLIFSDITNYLNVKMTASDIQKRINRKGNFIGEYELKTSSGKIIPVELSLTLFRNKNGQPVTSFAFKDISQERVTQKALEATEQQYKLQFNNTLEGTIIGKPDGHILLVNPAACDMLGYEATELEGKHRDIVFDMETPINRKAISKRREKGVFSGEVEFTHKKGHKIPVEVSSVIFETEDGEKKTIINIKDITSQKAIQKQLLEEKEFTESAISSLPTAFFVFNLKGEMVRWNTLLELDLEYSSKEIAQSNIMDLVHPDDQPMLTSIMKGELVGKKISVEARCKSKSGDTVHYLLRGTSFEQNGVKYIVGGGLNLNDLIEIENEKKLVKDELTRTKHFNELAVNGANLGLLEVDLTTGYTYFNERWFSLLGYDYDSDAAEFSKESFFSLVHPDDKHIPETEFLRSKEADDRYEAEFRLKAADGSYRWMLAVAKFMDYDENGEPTKLAGSHMDITKRKLAEEENKRNQKLLNQLFFNSPIGIVLVDTDGNVQSANQSFNQIFGYSEQEIKGKNLDETIVPASMDEQAESLSRLSFTGDSFQTETIRLHKNGKEIPVLVGGVPVELDGEAIAIYGMYVDITERKSLENQIVGLLETEKKARIQMQDMFQESPSAIAMLEGKDHIYSFANDKYKEMVGKNNLIDISIDQALPELKEQGLIELLDKCFETEETIYYKEKEVFFNKGENGKAKSHYLNFVCKPIHNDNREVYGIFVEAVDVTEQVLARNTIEQSLAEKETLLGEVHHRVKNNLAIVSGLLELEIIENNDPKISKHLHTTQSRVSTIAKIHELLYQNESLSHVSFKKYIQSVIKDGQYIGNHNAYRLVSSSDLDEVELNVNQAIPAGMVLNEILDYLDYISNKEQGDSPSDLIVCMTNSKDCVKIDLKNPDNQLLPLYNNDNDPNTDLRKELIKVLSTQIHGEVKLTFEPESVLSIHFAKNEAKGPHNALNV